jgi:hypothetical protein
MAEIKIERAGMKDLVFEGDVIGKSPKDNPEVKIYRTKGGKFVGAMKIRSCDETVGGSAMKSQ